MVISIESLLRDRISDLPDAIIIHILSLVDAKTAVRTGILSKRFAYLWTETPRLNFEGPTVDFLHTTLCFHKRLNLEKVSVTRCREFKSDSDGESNFYRFIRLLSLASVKELSLQIKQFLPQHFYSNPSLKKLTLRDCYILAVPFVNWKSLKTLSLEFVPLTDHSINRILSGSPSLVFLSLYEICTLFDLRRCYRINLSNNKCLRKLAIYRFYGRGTLEIVTPDLRSLILCGRMHWIKCNVLNAKSLTKCFLDFLIVDGEPNGVDVINMVTSLLDDLSHAEVVTIGEWVLQVLSLIELNKLPCPMSKAVKRLKIHTSLEKDDMTGIACLLRNLNRLEKLSIELYIYGKNYYLPLLSRRGEEPEEKKSCWTSEDMQTKVGSKLKNVWIEFQSDRQFQYDEVLSLAKLLLNNANFLEKMVIIPIGSRRSKQKFVDELRKFPRSSRLAVLKIGKVKHGRLIDVVAL